MICEKCGVLYGKMVKENSEYRIRSRKEAVSVPSNIFPLSLNGPQGKLINVFYAAGGNEPRPTLIFAHGYPGHEKNFDLAHDLRNQGFNVLIFFYSGCWGSSGAFSFHNSFADVNSVVDAIISSNIPNIDKNNLFFLGHSIGCIAAATATIRRPEIRGCIFLMPCDLGRIYYFERDNKKLLSELESILAEGIPWLNGVTTADLLDEISADPSAFSFDALLDQLQKKPVLWISGKEDNMAEESIHTTPHRKKMEKVPGCKIEWRSIKTDHYFSNARAQVAYEIINFLNKNVVNLKDIHSPEIFAENVREFVSTQYRTATLQTAAAHFHVSTSYFSSLVKRQFGKSFMVILTEVKMEKAAELLFKTDMSLNQISEFLGYTDSSYFMKVFKKFYQITPSEYRASR